ncbi:MAG: TonB-dependent receptor [Saprospiraceae bacterium]|nr:TonB-dependent receptor [Saprospiraceae bacterium]
MSKKIGILVIAIIFGFSSFAQNKGTIKGKVKDKATGESLIGVNILYDLGKGTITNIDGEYNMTIPYGEYTLKISYVGYKTITNVIKLNKDVMFLDFQLETTMLTEVEVVADMATTRETPVAFTNVTPAVIQEELASRDLPMILNQTPGVYATQQGGGDGDARINIRGFSQRNIAVMIDGIPVNDMENGWVYWSNWFGLDMVTRNIQVQRGLGSSKLAIPSVGGTMNIITKGIENKPGLTIKQEVSGDGFSRTSLGFNSGQLKHGWGVTFAGSYKKGEGYVDQNFTEGYFYFLRVDKKIGNHLLSISGLGAPQKHGQKAYQKPIAMFNKDLAGKLGVDTSNNSYFNTTYIDTNSMVDKGLRYNPHWGNLIRYKEGDSASMSPTPLNEGINYYHKPQFSLRDFWRVNDKLYISNIAYLSIGNGGGTRAKTSIKANDYDSLGQIDWQKFYDANAYSPWGIDASIHPTEHKSTQYLRSLINNHFWYGLLSTVSYEINQEFTFAGGIDLRSYKGEHYTEVYDLLGGDYAVDIVDANQESKVKRVGDKISYHNDNFVRWGGLFGQLEYKSGNLFAFVNASFAYSGHYRIDYFKKKIIDVGDTTLSIGFSDTVLYNGNTYTKDSEGLRYEDTEWKWFPGYTLKGGANYNLTETSNIFANVGYISKAPRFQNIFNYANETFVDIKNEIIKAVELGYSFYNSKFTLNVNGYLTYWDNKPVNSAFKITKLDPVTLDPVDYYANINGIDAFHKGIEIEFAHKLGKNITWERLLSVGDWKWNSGDSAYIYDEDRNLIGTTYFNAKGVHVGDAAQIQYGERIKWQFHKNAYLKGSVTYFSKYYAEFDPLSLTTDEPRDSWIIPSYFLIDLHAGYKFEISKIDFQLQASVLNLLDQLYISDATNNDSYSATTSAFNAQSAGVFIGLGRQFNVSLRISI